jgi:hypothetical protein
MGGLPSLVATAPYSTSNRVEVREWPSGLLIIDTRSWTAQMIDPRSSLLVVAKNALLSWGLSWDSGEQRETGTGLSVFGPTGQRRLHLFGPRPILDVQVVGQRAFVRKRNVASRYSVVSFRTGRQVRTIRGEMPLVLTGSGAPFYG